MGWSYKVIQACGSVCPDDSLSWSDERPRGKVSNASKASKQLLEKSAKTWLGTVSHTLGRSSECPSTVVVKSKRD
jgi:hypothetical protein